MVDWGHGVTFTVRKFTLRRRDRVIAELGEAVEKWNSLLSERKVLAESAESDATNRISVIDEEMARISRESFTPAYFRHGLLGIEGLEVDGEPATVESIQRLAAEMESEDWPEIVHDILQSILGEFQLEEAAAGESGPPTTSQS